MTKYCPRAIVLLALIGLVVVVAPVRAFAQQAPKPALVVSIASVDKLLADIGYLTRAAGTPELGGMVTLIAGPYLEGLDTKKPAGMYLNMSGPRPTGVAFLPVSDFDAVIAKIEDTVGEPEDLGGGVKKLSLQRDIFFKEEGGWAYITDSSANLENVPRDPSAELGDLPANYEVAVRVNVQSIPAPLRTMAISELREGFQRGLGGALQGEAREMQERIGRRGIENLVSFIEDADEITLGWGVDSDQGATFIDVDVSAMAGTELARQFALLDGNKTRFAGFLLPDAAAKLHFSSRAGPRDIEHVKLMVEMARKKALEEIEKDGDLPNDEARQTVKEVVSSLMDVVDDTISTGRFDGGAALLLNNGNLQFVAGGFVADGVAFEKNLKRLVEMGQSFENDPVLDQIKFNVGSHRGISLHTIDVPIPENEDEARKVFGSSLSIIAGTGPRSLFVALGTDNRALLESVIDESAEQGEVVLAPVTFDVALTPILEFASTIESNPMVKMMADALRETNGKDHVSLVATTISRGISYRIRLDEGVLKLIGQVGKMQGNRR